MVKGEHKTGPAGNYDYIKHGSDEHAQMIGLRKAETGEELQLDGWTLEDRTAWGPQATESYMREVLRQKVAEVRAGAPPTLQSEEPFKPNYMPGLWRPVDAEGNVIETTGMV